MQISSKLQIYGVGFAISKTSTWTISVSEQLSVVLTVLRYTMKVAYHQPFSWKGPEEFQTLLVIL